MSSDTDVGNKVRIVGPNRVEEQSNPDPEATVDLESTTVSYDTTEPHVRFDEAAQVDDDSARLAKFLSATSKPKFRTVKVPSIGTTFVLRSLSASEYNMIFEMQSGKFMSDVVKGNKRIKEQRRYAQTEIWAKTIELGLHSPNLKDPAISEQLLRKYASPSISDALMQVLLPGELMALAEAVGNLSGDDMDEDLITEAKN